MSALLVGVDLLDELSAGVPVVAAPDIQSAFALRYSTAALILFVIPQIVGLVLEPPLYVLADRHPRRRFVVGGLVTMAFCNLVAGLSWSLAPFAAALGLTAAASGVGVNLAQATLMDEHPRDRDRMMTLWSLAGMGGDFAAPACFGVLSYLALGWRTAFVASALLLLAYAFALGRQRFPHHRTAEREHAPRLGAAVRGALGNRGLLLWLFGVWLCCMLDEILVAFGSMYLRDRLNLGTVERSLVLMSFVVGSIVGLLATERLLRRGGDPLAMLRWGGASCALAYGAWIVAPGAAWSAALLALVGFLAAPLYPIAQAQAYRALPGQSGMVNAVSMVFRPLEIALPLVIGLVADHLGLGVALALLAAQPLGLLAIGMALRSNRACTTPPVA